MKKIIIVGMVLIAGLGACKSKKKAGNGDATKNTSTESNTTTTNNVINVSFISIGSGTDGKTRTLMLEYLESFQIEKNIRLQVDARPWGREGEVDYCIQMSSLDALQKEELEVNLRKIVDGHDLVKMRAGDACQQKK